MDLDIQNYSLDEILNLFKIPSNFDENDLKRAKKLVLKSHPDKSKLPSEYFLFYSKAYKILFSIYEFKNKSRNDQTTDYTIINNEMKDTNQDNTVEQYLKKNKINDFSKWFNEEFEKRTDIEKQKGYEEWLKSDEGIENVTVKLNEMNNYFEKKKKDLVVKQEIKEFVSGNNYLDLSGNEEYNSDMFSSLYYSDLKQAHSIIPVSLDYNIKKLDEYQRERKIEDIQNIPLSKEESLKVLNQKMKTEEDEAITRAYYFAKKTQESEKSNQLFMAKMKRLK
jgi:hypothetical protein